MPLAPLFVYGTLRDPDILAAVLGRRSVAGVTAVLHGYRAVLYPGRSYPALAPARGWSAAGLLIAGLLPEDFAALDAFETQEYRREPVRVETAAGPAEAQTYMPAVEIGADAPEWTLEEWTLRHKAAMLSGELGHRPQPR